MITYYRHPTGSIQTPDGRFVPPDPGNRDYADILRHVADGDGVIEDVVTPPTVSHYARAIQDHLDRTARERQYESILSAITYRDDPNPQFAAEAAALFEWRSAVWSAAVVMMEQVGSSGDPPPTIEQVVEMLPTFEWPE